MKCLLLNSPIYWDSTFADEEYLPPIGLGYIATHISKVGIDVEIIDCVKKHLGVSETVALIKEKEPEYIGINIFTQNYEIVKCILENCPESCTLILGGQVVKSIYANVLTWEIKNKLILILGEGELILPAIISLTCKDKPFYSGDNKIIYVVNQDSSYFPVDLSLIQLDRSLLRDEIIKNHYGQNETAIITSRGCMYNCAFCGGARNLNCDITIRFREPEDIITEINDIKAIYSDVNSIRVLDDLFLRNRASINKAISVFANYTDLSWRGMAHALSFIDSLDLLDALRNCGCRELFIGIESGSDRIREKINKVGKVEQVLSVAEAIMTAGIDVKGYFIYGFPNEGLEDFKKTYELAAKLKNISEQVSGNFRCSVFQFRPYHGTQLYKEILNSGKIIKTILANERINVVPGRSQFNFQFGNFSDVDSDTLNQYILETQGLSEGFHHA